MRAFFAFLWIVLACSNVNGQVTGRLLDRHTGEAIPSATVQVLGGVSGALTDESGQFNLDFKPPSSQNLQIVFTSVGYEPDTVAWQSSWNGKDIYLESKTQEGVVITGTMKPSLVGQSPIKVEVLSREFIRQIPGANTLMDVVDYVAGVRQQVNCGVCGTNDIHINGMEGPYTLVLIDGMPIISALGSVYGLNGIPASMIEQIEIIKGPASTLYGSDAMGGVINIILRDPAKAPRLSAEMQGSSHQELNADLGMRIQKDRLRGLLGLNMHSMQNRLDGNGDGFTDVPLSKRISLFNHWSIERPLGREARIAGKFYMEDRFGGQLHWTPEFRGSDSVYGENIRTLRAELIGKYRLPTHADIRFEFSVSHHDQDSWYGNTALNATQQVGYATLYHHAEFGNHQVLIGAATRVNLYDDNTPATAKAVSQVLPGIFVQDEWSPSQRLTLLAGARLEHDRSHGFIFSPRVNLKWKPRAFHTIRLTGGTGFRTVNIFTEEHAALTGSRDVVIEEALDPERSMNANLNYMTVLNLGESAINLDFDAFYTFFQNRILPDYDSNPNWILYRNLEGHAVIRGASIKLAHSFRFPLRYEVGATWLQSWTVESGQKEWQEFVPRMEIVHSLSYRIDKIHTVLDWNGRITGPMDLPEFEPPFVRPSQSPWFSVHNIQLSTKVKPQWTILFGVRNILNHTQPSPLINPSQPFSDSFDATYAYGPLQGRRFILGLRVQLD